MTGLGLGRYVQLNKHTLLPTIVLVVLNFTDNVHFTGVFESHTKHLCPDVYSDKAYAAILLLLKHTPL